jgi:hypothetical protein
MYDSRNDKKSLSNVSENISSSSIHIDQDQEEQLSVKREEVKSANLEKTGLSNFPNWNIQFWQNRKLLG